MRRYKPYVDHQEWLLKSLKDPEMASEYLNAVLEEGDKQLFLMALKNVVDAQGGMTKMSDKSKINRVSLYKMLSKNGNPGFENILRLLQIAGIRFRVTPQSRRK